MSVIPTSTNSQHSKGCAFRSNEVEVNASQIQFVPGKKNKINYNDFFYTWKQDYKSAREYICCEKRKSGTCPAKLKHYSSKQWMHIGQHNHAPPGTTLQTTVLDSVDTKQNVHQPSKRLENPFELVTRADLAFTQDGQPFIRDGKFYPSLTIMFASNMQLNTLNSISEYDQIFFDARPGVCPYGVSQLITILVKKQGFSPVPVFYVFAESKEEKVYKRVWKKVCKLCPKLKSATQLHVTVDFDVEMHNAIRTFLPSAEIVGCSFQWRQSINRWLENNRSKDDLIKQPEIYEKLQKDLKQLCETNQSEIFSSSVKNFQQYFSIIDVDFVQYLNRNYLDNDAPFPPTMWAHSQRTRLLPDKTNNPIEQYYQIINTCFKNRPSLITSVLLLQRFEYLARMGRLYEQSCSVPEEFVQDGFELNKKRKLTTSELDTESTLKKIKGSIEEANS